MNWTNTIDTIWQEANARMDLICMTILSCEERDVYGAIERSDMKSLLALLGREQETKPIPAPGLERTLQRDRMCLQHLKCLARTASCAMVQEAWRECNILVQAHRGKPGFGPIAAQARLAMGLMADGDWSGAEAAVKMLGNLDGHDENTFVPSPMAGCLESDPTALDAVKRTAWLLARVPDECES